MKNSKNLKLLGMHIFGAVIFSILVCAVFWGSPDVQSVSNKNKILLSPVNVVGKDTAQQQYEFDVSGIDKTGESLIFFSGHQVINVFADGMNIYSVNPGDDIFSSTTGPRWDYVDIPSDCNNITITLDAVYKNIPMKSFTVYLGNAGADMLSRLRSSFPAACMDFVISAVGIILIVFWILERKNATNQRSVLYFGFFVLFMGLWCFNETEFMTILFDNRCGASFLSFVMLMLIPVPYVKYLTTFIDFGKKFFAKLIVRLAVLNTCVCVGLHLLGIASVKQTGITSQILLLSAAVYHIWTLFAYYRHKGMDILLITNLIGTSGIIISGLFDLWHYYTSMQKNPVIAHFGILISVICLGVSAFSAAKNNIDEVKSMHQYKEIALKDLQTGLFNRNAYDRLVYSKKDFTNTAIIVFDINNLKICNDTFGHDAGDRLINNSAGLISEFFCRHGEIYRIGGDEFCVLFSYKDKNNVISKVNKFRKIQSLDDNPQHVSIACGYAFFDAEKDSSIENTRKRADKVLYEDKRNMKRLMKKSATVYA